VAVAVAVAVAVVAAAAAAVVAVVVVVVIILTSLSQTPFCIAVTTNCGIRYRVYPTVSSTGHGHHHS